MDKPFALGILVGRFQTLHAGHQQMIETALSLCGQVGIFIGSSQESGTRKNPFPYELREKMLENVKARFGRLPDLLVSGKEARRLDWFDSVEGVRIAELYIPKTIEISASQMREFLLRDDRASWERYVSREIHSLYPELRALMLASQKNERTMSI